MKKVLLTLMLFVVMATMTQAQWIDKVIIKDTLNTIYGDTVINPRIDLAGRYFYNENTEEFQIAVIIEKANGQPVKLEFLPYERFDITNVPYDSMETANENARAGWYIKKYIVTIIDTLELEYSDFQYINK